VLSISERGKVSRSLKCDRNGEGWYQACILRLPQFRWAAGEMDGAAIQRILSEGWTGYLGAGVY
jgi:hypothetical protein